MSATKTTGERVDGLEIRRASSPGFYELWAGGQFCGMYYSVERARQAAQSPYGEHCRRKYGVSVAGPRYFVLDNWTTLDCRRRWTVGEAGKAHAIDHYRSRRSAEYAASLLNAGTGRVDPHAVVGCRVVALTYGEWVGGER